ncbi:PHD finger protein 3-like [Heterodontus francisci]|uniref:PHD finger protein 3-like n=1 Tax=Heterodontus francisci TaxID=7792 RepID=UPI00355C324D
MVKEESWCQLKGMVQFHPRTQSVWRGFIQVSNMKRFLVKAYPVLGHTDLLTKVLSTTITVGRCVLPEAIWDSVDRLRSSGTKEICVVRFKPATRGDTYPYALYYSYLNSRQKYSAVILEQRSPKNVYLIPLPALQKVPSRLPPLSGPGLESFHPDLLLALAFTKKQHSTSAFKKPHECRRGPDRCLQENKSRQKCIEDIDKEHLPGQSQLSPFLAKPGVQPCILPMLPTIPFTQARELLHHSCQVKPSDLLLGDLLSSEELSSHTDLSNNFADEILKSFYCEEQQSDRIGNMFGSSAFTGEWENDGQNEDLAANEQQHHGDGTGKENESRAGSERLNIETNLLTQFKPADVLPENFLLSVTELNSVLQQADESQKEGATPTNEQEADWTASTEYTEDMETYIKELDKLFTNVPLSSFSQHEDCSHLRSTISCCADVLNHLLSASENNLPCETQIPMCSQGSPNSIISSQEGPRHTTQTDSPLPLLTVQMSNNFQHLGPSGTMNFEPGVLLHALPANEVTVHPVEVPFQNVTEPLFPFRFNPSHCQRGIDAESHELPQCLLSPYCPTHCTNVHKDIGQSPTTSSGAPSSSSDGVL